MAHIFILSSYFPAGKFLHGGKHAGAAFIPPAAGKTGYAGRQLTAA
jgi:hypothetical protein